MKKKIDISLILLIVLLSLGLLLFGGMFINSIQNYSRFGNISYDDLEYEQLTFKKFKFVSGYKISPTYEIYFEEYEEAFCMQNHTLTALNETALKQLKSGEIVELYYKNAKDKNYIFDICEINNEDTIFLSLEDYKRVNQNSEIVGLIIGPIFFLLESSLLFIIIKNRGFPTMKKLSK